MGVRIGWAGSPSYYTRGSSSRPRDPDGQASIKSVVVPPWLADRVDETDAQKRTRRALTIALSGRLPGGALVAPGLGRGGRRRRGYDVDVSADKAVSVAWLLAQDEHQRAAIEAAHDTAVAAVVSAIAEVPLEVRSGRAGARREPTCAPIFVLRHYWSRPAPVGKRLLPAPHLHEHVVVANLAQRADGAIRSLDARLLYGAVTRLGDLYRARLDAGLAAAGLEPKRGEGGTLVVAGLDPTLVAAFAPRRRELVEATDHLPLAVATAKRRHLAKVLRRCKSQKTFEEAQAAWRAVAAELSAGRAATAHVDTPEAPAPREVDRTSTHRPASAQEHEETPGVTEARGMEAREIEARESETREIEAREIGFEDVEPRETEADLPGPRRG